MNQTKIDRNPVTEYFWDSVNFETNTLKIDIFKVLAGINFGGPFLSFSLQGNNTITPKTDFIITHNK